MSITTAPIGFPVGTPIMAFGNLSHQARMAASSVGASFKPPVPPSPPGAGGRFVAGWHGKTGQPRLPYSSAAALMVARAVLRRPAPENEPAGGQLTPPPRCAAPHTPRVV